MRETVKPQIISEWVNLDDTPPSSPVRRMMFLILRHAVRTGARDVQMIPNADNYVLTFKVADGSVVSQLSLGSPLAESLVRAAQAFAKKPVNALSGTIKVLHGKQNIQIELSISPSPAGKALRLDLGAVAQVNRKEILQEKEVFKGHMHKAERDYVVGQNEEVRQTLTPKHKARFAEILRWCILIATVLGAVLAFVYKDPISKRVQAAWSTLFPGEESDIPGLDDIKNTADKVKEEEEKKQKILDGLENE